MIVAIVEKQLMVGNLLFMKFEYEMDLYVVCRIFDGLLADSRSPKVIVIDLR